MDLRVTRWTVKVSEKHWPACKGSGLSAVKKPALPGRKIYPGPCKKCGGKGRVAKSAD